MGRGRGNRDGGGGRGSGTGQGGGRGGGRMGGPNAAGPSGYCVCPSCGHRKQHVTGVPCYNQKCPKCGTQMIRE